MKIIFEHNTKKAKNNTVRLHAKNATQLVQKKLYVRIPRRQFPVTWTKIGMGNLRLKRKEIILSANFFAIFATPS
jgi:hypothetical protein